MVGANKVEIGGRRYRIRRYDAFKGLETLGDLQAQLLVPALGVLDGKEAGSDEAFAAQAMGGLGRILRGLPGRDLKKLAEKIIDPELVSIEAPDGSDAEKLTAEAVLRNDLTAGDLIELCVEVVKWNYGDFLERAGARFGPAISRLTKRPASSGTTSRLN